MLVKICYYYYQFSTFTISSLLLPSVHCSSSQVLKSPCLFLKYPKEEECVSFHIIYKYINLQLIAENAWLYHFVFVYLSMRKDLKGVSMTKKKGTKKPYPKK